MAAVSYKDIPVWIGTGAGVYRDFTQFPISNFVLAQNVSIQNQNKLSTNRMLNSFQSTQFDNYGIDGPQDIKVSVTFIADTSGSGVVNCLNHLTGDMGGYIVVGDDFYGTSYLNNLSVNIQPFAPVTITADFSCYNFENSSEFVLIEGNYTWFQARENAKARGGRLAILDSKEKNNRVPAYTLARYMWIGATGQGDAIGRIDARKLGYKWIDGSLLDPYNNWADGEPSQTTNENYVTRASWGKWYNVANTFNPAAHGEGYILEYNKTNIIDTAKSQPQNISSYKQKIIYGHSVSVDDEGSLSDKTKDSISYSVSCARTPVYTIGSVLPRKFFLDVVEKEISIKSTNITKFIDYLGYNGSISIDLKDETGKLATTISFEKARVMSQSLSAQEGDILVAEIKAKEVIL